MRILVVEDEQGISKFLKQGLEEESFAVDVADNGKVGLELALSGNYDGLDGARNKWHRTHTAVSQGVSCHAHYFFNGQGYGG